MLELNCAMSYKDVPKAYNQYIPVISACSGDKCGKPKEDTRGTKRKNLSMFKQYKNICLIIFYFLHFNILHYFVIQIYKYLNCSFFNISKLMQFDILQQDCCNFM